MEHKNRYLTGLSNEDYQASPEISKSKLDLFDTNQQSIQWSKTCPVDHDKLKTLDFGDAMHAICLEPDRLINEFLVMPVFNGRTNDGKQAKKEWIEAHSDKKIITELEHKKLTLMFDSVMSHPTARDLMEREGVAEASHFWEDPDTGVLCRCRPDRDITDTPVIVDVKTTDDIKKFHYSVYDYRYYVQEPFYLDGYNASRPDVMPKKKMIFLVIQKTIELGRYPVDCIVLPDYAVSHGRDTYKKNLADYGLCVKTGNFTGIRTLEMGYKFKQAAEYE